jgi:uncharacterized protein YegL
VFAIEERGEKKKETRELREERERERENKRRSFVSFFVILSQSLSLAL